MGEFIRFRIAKPFINTGPYLDESIDMEYEFPKGHFFYELGEHIEEEAKVEKEEKLDKHNLPKKEKIEQGYFLESVRVKESGIGVSKIEISNTICNFGKGSAINIISKHSGQSYEAFCLDSDGDILIVESNKWTGIPSEVIDVEENFLFYKQFNNMWVDHYYRLYRTKLNISKVELKLQGISSPLNWNLVSVERVGNLDTSQLKAFHECLNNNPVTLIQGPPGTGKTTFAASLATYLVELGHSVLVTAFTHDAINNILERIHKLGTSVNKIGRKSKCSELLEPFREDDLSASCCSNIVIGMTVHQLLKNHRKFDFILVDEASQMDIVSGLHFLASSAKTIFIGDQMQLPNISKVANSEYSFSIFDLLLKAYKPTTLRITYRFNQKICDYISSSFYEGLLECSDAVKNNYLELDNINSDIKFQAVLDRNPLVFIDTKEEVDFSLNVEQADITVDLIVELLKSGLYQEDIGVIAPTNTQVNYIKRKLGVMGVKRKGILIETVNKFQGQEKSLIIFNTVVTTAKSEKVRYDFFFDIRRFNVAVSRAKKKVVVLGSSSLFMNIPNQIVGGVKIRQYLDQSLNIRIPIGAKQ